MNKIIIALGMLLCFSLSEASPCNAWNEGQRLPHEKDCRKFYLCNQYIPNQDTSLVIDCCDNSDGSLMYFDPVKRVCTKDASVCPDCSDPCNARNQFSRQPCSNDCTKFWMCNENVPNQNSSLLLSCCTNSDTVLYFDPVSQFCVEDNNVCRN